jgi:hypothetical protein
VAGLGLADVAGNGHLAAGNGERLAAGHGSPAGGERLAGDGSPAKRGGDG